MTTIVAVSGSLRRDSFNTALLNTAREIMPSGSVLAVRSIRDIPLYDADVEAVGIPQPVTDLKDAIASADGLLLVTPEYNNSIPGVLKNVVDWLSRPPADIKRVFGDKPVAVMGASEGNFGTVLSQAAWLPVLRTLGTRPWWGRRLLVPRANEVFNESGVLIDEAVKKKLQQFLSGFVEFAKAM
jgi:chromate reductase, NAD(P)H dehydrogenase (quinone)